MEHPHLPSAKITPVWLVSNGLIGWNGLDGEPMVDAVEKIGELWPTKLAVIFGGLCERGGRPCR